MGTMHATSVSAQQREARALDAWEPTAAELARLILLEQSEPDICISHCALGQWSFYRLHASQHITFCERTGCAYLTELGPFPDLGTRSVRWVTKAQALAALRLPEDALER